MNTVGIDLGTTNSVCCTVKDGKFEYIKFRNKDLLPSNFMYKDGKITVGDMARRKAIIFPENYISSSKTFIGDNDKVWAIDDKEFNPTDIATEVLQSIKDAAIKYFGNEEPITAVITVPAYFNSNQIDETKKAGEKAGFIVKQIVTEPIAAAVAYGIDEEKSDIKLFVVDIGGGTFDVSLLEKKGKNQFKSLVIDGDRKLGGDDFDEIILEMFLKHIRQNKGIDLSNFEKSILSSDQYHQAKQKLVLEAERAKIDLSSMEAVTVEIPALFNENNNIYDFSMEVTREKFIDNAQILINKIKRTIKNSIEDNNYSIDDVEKVILVGGTSNLQVIREFVTEYFEKEPFADKDLSKLVAMGAALISDDEDNTIMLKDIISHSLGIEVFGNKFSKILVKNDEYPCTKSEIFTTTVDYQEAVDINIFEGEDIEDVENNDFYGSFSLNNIEQAAAGIPQIEVTFSFDKSRTLQVTAKDLNTGALRTETVSIEKGVKREKPKETYYDIAILLDNSGSMMGSDMDNAKNACREMVNSLIDLENNRIGIISFETYSQVRSKLTHDKSQLLAAISPIIATGGTNMSAAFYDAKQILSDSENNPLAIMVTDGCPNSETDARSSAKELIGEGIRLITIGVGYGVNSNFLKEIASSSDDYYFVENMDKLKDVFSEIAQGLKKL